MVTITLLGEQSVVDPVTGETLTRSTRSIALVGLLVARTGAPQSRSTIAGAFWPESGESQAMTNLRRELHQLRRWIDDDSLEVTGSHLCWHDRGRHRVDLGTFLTARARATAPGADPATVLEHGCRALAAYAGDLLPGLEGEWLEQLRAELRGVCVELCGVVATAAVALDRTDVALEVLRKQAALDPYDEPAHRWLMELLVETGDRAGAVRVFQRLSARLESELGVSPDPRTAAVLPSLTEPTTGVARRRSRLVGRDAELARLRARWAAAEAGRAQVVAVTGPAGVGKSRLVEELAREVWAAGGLTALGRCSESSGRLPYAPVAAWLRTPAVAEARAALEPVWAAEVERLVPRAAGAAPGGATEAWQQHRFLEGLVRALLAAARPTLLVLDDLQWSDADSLQVLSALLAVAPRAPVLVVTVTRPEGDAHGWLTGLRRSRLVAEVALAPFGERVTAALAHELTGAWPADPALLHQATGGYPLYVVEATRTDNWSDILARRLDQLSPPARATAALAAALGRDFTLPLLTRASELDTATVVTAVEELWRRQLLRVSGERYDFSHDLVRRAAYETASPPHRWLLHRRLAEALQVEYADHPGRVAALVAEQYARAGDSEPAARWHLWARASAIDLRIRRAGALASGSAHAERFANAPLTTVAAPPS